MKQGLLSPSAPPKLGRPLAQLSRETHIHTRTPRHPCPTNTRRVLPSGERGTQAGPESWLQPVNLCRFLDKQCRRWEPQFLGCRAGVMSAPTPRRCSQAQRKGGARLAEGERGRLSPRSAIRERAGRSLHELLPYLAPAWGEDSILFPLLQLRKLRRRAERTSSDHAAGQGRPRVSPGRWLSLASRQPPAQACGPHWTHATAGTRGARDVCADTPGGGVPASQGRNSADPGPHSWLLSQVPRVSKHP